MSDLEPIAHIYTDFPTKFGIPRQSTLVPELTGRIVFTEKYRRPEAVQGLEDFSHIWLLWQFSENLERAWSPSVRPPRLGGNTRKGVFATRSPFRPNHIGLSCVKLEKIEETAAEGTTLTVSGVDLMSGTPILDIKPYLAYADSHPQARGGFTDNLAPAGLDVTVPGALAQKLPTEKLRALTAILAQDPRPSYQDDPERIYGFGFAGFEIKFQVRGNHLQVLEIANNSCKS